MNENTPRYQIVMYPGGDFRLQDTHKLNSRGTPKTFGPRFRNQDAAQAKADKLNQGHQS